MYVTNLAQQREPIIQQIDAVLLPPSQNADEIFELSSLGFTKERTLSKHANSMKNQLTQSLKAVTCRITDSSERVFGTGVLHRFAPPPSSQSSMSQESFLYLVTSSEVLPSAEDALGSSVELIEPGSSDCHRLELVWRYFLF